MVDTSTERFDRVAADPEYVAAQTRTIERPQASGYPVLVAAAFTVFWVFLIARMHGMPGVIRLLFLGLGLAAGYRMVTAAMRVRAEQRAPVVPVVAVVVRDRSDVSGGGREGQRATTSYFVTLQTRDGTRAEYAASSALAGRMAVGDIGVAYVAGNSVIEFTRFDA
jgi:hypothetical protein